MSKINDKSKYPLDINISENDYLIGTDGDSGSKKTRNFSIAEVAKFVQSYNGSSFSNASWVYSCSGDEFEYGNFYTPGVCFTGNDDPGFLDLTEIIISNKTLSNIDALRYLGLGNNGGVVMLIINKNDISNFVLINNLTVHPSSIDGYSTLIFSDIESSKSFRQGDEYSFMLLGSSPNFLRLIREKKTVLANTTAPTEDDAVHIGQNNAVRVYKDKIELDHNAIILPSSLFTNLNSLDLPSDPDAIKSFRVLCINNAGRIYPLTYGDVQPNWLDENENSRYHIKNRYPQKYISENYTLQPSDNGHTLFINNGTGDIVISINRNNVGMDVFRQCRIVQLGTGNVQVVQGTGGPQYVFAKVVGNKIGGAITECMLIRQVSIIDEVTTLGNFYLFNGQSAGVEWSQESI